MKWVCSRLVGLPLIAVLLTKTATAVARVVFSPGYGGSDLYMTLEDEKAVPKDCIRLNLPIGRKFLAIRVERALC